MPVPGVEPYMLRLIFTEVPTSDQSPDLLREEQPLSWQCEAVQLNTQWKLQQSLCCFTRKYKKDFYITKVLKSKKSSLFFGIFVFSVLSAEEFIDIKNTL